MAGYIKSEVNWSKLKIDYRRQCSLRVYELFKEQTFKILSTIDYGWQEKSCNRVTEMNAM